MAFFFGLSDRVIFIASFRKIRGNMATRFEEEAEDMDSRDLVMMKISGMILSLAVMIFIVGLDRKSGIILSFPLI